MTLFHRTAHVMLKAPCACDLASAPLGLMKCVSTGDDNNCVHSSLQLPDDLKPSGEHCPLTPPRPRGTADFRR